MEKQETTTQIPNSNEHCDNLSCDKRRKGLDKISKGKNTHERNRQKGMVSAFVQGKGQNAALKWLMESKTPVCIYLISGVKFEGEISSFDAFTSITSTLSPSLYILLLFSPINNSCSSS